MKRLALFLLLALSIAAEAVPRKKIRIDYGKPSELYHIDSRAGDVFALRVRLYSEGERYIPTAEDGFLIGFGTNGVFSQALVITNGTPSLLSNFVDFVVSGLTLDTTYFSQVLLTNTVNGSVSIFGEGKAEVTRNPLGGSTLDLELREVLNFSQFLLLNTEALGIITTSTNGVFISGVNRLDFSNFTASVSTVGTTTTLTIVSAGMGAITGDVAAIIFTQAQHTVSINALSATQEVIGLSYVLDIDNTSTSSMTIADLGAQVITSQTNRAQFIEVEENFRFIGLGSHFIDGHTGTVFTVGYPFDASQAIAIFFHREGTASNDEGYIGFHGPSSGQSGMIFGRDPSVGGPNAMVEMDFLNRLMSIHNGAALAADGALTGGIDVVLDTAASIVLVSADCRGSIRLNADDDAISWTGPPVSKDDIFTVANAKFNQVLTVVIDAGDNIILDGNTLATGKGIFSAATNTAKATLVGIDSTTWWVVSKDGLWTVSP